MLITDFKKGLRVQYIGPLSARAGQLATVSGVNEFQGVQVQWDELPMTGPIPYYSASSFRELLNQNPAPRQVAGDTMVIGGITTTKRTVVLSGEPERGKGLKDDTGKAQPRLLFQGVPLALAEVVKTLTFGAKKYAAHSWQHVENGEDRYQDASYRHDAARCSGEVIDPETGIMHRAHHIINELFLLEMELRNKK